MIGAPSGVSIPLACLYSVAITFVSGLGSLNNLLPAATVTSGRSVAFFLTPVTVTSGRSVAFAFLSLSTTLKIWASKSLICLSASGLNAGSRFFDCSTKASFFFIRSIASALAASERSSGTFLMSACV